MVGGGGGDVINIFTCKKIKAMFTLYWITFAPARKLYRIGLFTHAL